MKLKLLCVFMIVITAEALPFPFSPLKDTTESPSRFQVSVGPCTWIFDRKCPDNEIKFFLYTKKNRNDRQVIYVDDTWEKSNISQSHFEPNDPVKIIIHGYNSDMFLTPLISMKDEYLERDDYNLFYVDWSSLAPAPCYPSAAHNTRHAGKCIAQLVDRIRDAGTENIHLLGFSLGAHVTNFVARNLKDFKIHRITGLDPALPLFITASREDKLDASDAHFVDVIHSNALIQGKIEQCGHVDFYMNGGIIQPGCTQSDTNPIACSHHRAPDYFTESINSERGFWGWSCASYINYLLGFCPRNGNIHQAGEDCRPNTNGMYLITTNSASPFAAGQWQTITTSGNKNTDNHYRRDPSHEEINGWQKLEGEFNNRGFHKKFDQQSTDWNQLHQIENELINLDKIQQKVNSLTRRNDKFIHDNRVQIATNSSMLMLPTYESFDSDPYIYPAKLR